MILFDCLYFYTDPILAQFYRIEMDKANYLFIICFFSNPTKQMYQEVIEAINNTEKCAGDNIRCLSDQQIERLIQNLNYVYTIEEDYRVLRKVRALQRLLFDHRRNRKNQLQLDQQNNRKLLQQKNRQLLQQKNRQLLQQKNRQLLQQKNRQGRLSLDQQRNRQEQRREDNLRELRQEKHHRATRQQIARFKEHFNYLVILTFLIFVLVAILGYLVLQRQRDQPQRNLVPDLKPQTYRQQQSALQITDYQESSNITQQLGNRHQRQFIDNLEQAQAHSQDVSKSQHVKQPTIPADHGVQNGLSPQQ